MFNRKSWIFPRCSRQCCGIWFRILLNNQRCSQIIFQAQRKKSDTRISFLLKFTCTILTSIRLCIFSIDITFVYLSRLANYYVIINDYSCAQILPGKSGYYHKYLRKMLHSSKPLNYFHHTKSIGQIAFGQMNWNIGICSPVNNDDNKMIFIEIKWLKNINWTLKCRWK